MLNRINLLRFDFIYQVCQIIKRYIHYENSILHHQLKILNCVCTLLNKIFYRVNNRENLFFGM